MPKYKAKFTGKVRDKNGYAVHLFYEYRGHEYMVTDEHNGYSEPMWVKHKNEQERIDREIDSQFKPSASCEPAEVGLNLFFDYVENPEKYE